MVQKSSECIGKIIYYSLMSGLSDIYLGYRTAEPKVLSRCFEVFEV